MAVATTVYTKCTIAGFTEEHTGMSVSVYDEWEVAVLLLAGDILVRVISGVSAQQQLAVFMLESTI